MEYLQYFIFQQHLLRCAGQVINIAAKKGIAAFGIPYEQYIAHLIDDISSDEEVMMKVN